MNSDLTLGVWDENSILPAGAMRMVMTPTQVKRATAVMHRLPGRRGPNITVWYGAPGLGKTGTAMILCRTIHAHTGVHAAYMDAPTPRSSGHDERSVLRAILANGVGRIPDRAFRSRTDQEIADMILTAMFARNIRLLIIDEAGRLGFRGLEAIGVLVDRAAMMDDDFHVVLVGMERLPQALQSNDRMRSRVAAWEHFNPLPPDVFESVLRELYPRALGNPTAEERSAAMLALHKETGGSLREAISVLSEAQVFEAGSGRCIGADNILALLHLQRTNCKRITTDAEPTSQGRTRRKYQTAHPRAAV